MRLTDAELSARNRRNAWIAGALVAFIVLIFLTTFLRMQRNLAERKAMQAEIVAGAPR
jgi:hypothetical protein